MSTADLARLVGLAAVWDLAFVFIRVAVPPLGPVALTVSRTLLAGCALLAYAHALRVAPRWRERWPQFVAFGFFNSAVPFVLIAAAEQAMTAAFSAILVATTPLFGAVIATFWARVPLTLPSTIEWVNTVALALASSAAAFVLYFRLIANVGPVKTLTVNFLSPLFGVGGGAALLGEPVTANMVAGAAVILSGTALVLRGRG